MSDILTAAQVAEIEARAACQPPFDMDKDEARVSIAALCASLRHAMELLRRWNNCYNDPLSNLDSDTAAALAAWYGEKRDEHT